MLQKRNDLEIIEVLRKGPSHIREIGEKLDIIPSTVMRTIKRLEEDKVVDFKKTGKNKTYFLKDTIEAQSYLFMAEHYKLMKVSQNPKLRRLVNQLKNQTSGELIVLFGSQAKGSATKTSDVDVYVETSSPKLRTKLRELSSELSIKIGKLSKDDLLSKEIIKNHIIIQNVERFYRIIQ